MFITLAQSRAVIACGALTLAACTTSSATTPPATTSAAATSPSSINPPDGQRIMALTASGVQTYVCEADAQQHLAWVFKSPQATLFDASGRTVLRHAAGPSWQADDGSRIVGRAIAQRPSDTPASVPQLLLETHSTAGDGMLSAVRYVQRVKTVGGVMPSAPCTVAGQSGSSPYLAEYVFYK
ncbi:DUF3455 domain-containing protein [Paraburkholderia aromaticivorans]|uniref:DUF3455 domain-containing protein n=1 Tax=Paraburkholderia aromaticivorans TaxID=2026199 RepID=A0A248VX23_9BURK|nr:DUF3455 domain-containing protein [Paraburkholderia aromaticivorans]ASW03517.1 hypothetical protein CJU94_35780 [Paraburkholderia aromaticivorans]